MNMNGTTLKRLMPAARATLALILALSPGLAHASPRGRAAAPKVALVAAVSQFAALPQLPKSLPSIAAAIPATASQIQSAADAAVPGPRALETLSAAGLEAPRMRESGGSVSSLKEDSAKRFDAAGEHKARDSVDAGAALAGPAESGLSRALPGRLAVRAAVPAPKSAVSKLLSYWPAAAAAGFAALAHALGAPEAGAAAPLFLMLGTTRDNSASDESRLQAAFPLAKFGGRVVTATDMIRAGALLGLNTDRLWAAVGKLSDQGRFISLDGGLTVVVDFDAEPPTVRTATFQARDAVKLLNEDHWTAHARGIARLQGAYESYREARAAGETSEMVAAQQRHIQTAHANAVFQLMRDAVNISVAETAKRVDAATAKRYKDSLKPAADWLANAYVDAEHPLKRPSVEAHGLVVAAVARLRGSLGAHPQLKEVEAGLAIMSGFLRSLAPQQDEAYADTIAGLIENHFKAARALTLETFNESFDKQRVAAALDILADRGFLVRLTDGSYLFTRTYQRAHGDAPSPELKQAFMNALVGSKMLSGTSVIDRSVAVYALSRGLSLLEDNELGPGHVEYAETKALYENGLYLLLESVLKLYKEQGAQGSELQAADRTLAKLATMRATTKEDAVGLEREHGEWAAGLVDRLVSEGSLLASRRNSAEILEGLRRLELFLKNPIDHLDLAKASLSQSSERKALPAPKGAATAKLANGYELIGPGDEKFKALNRFGVNVTGLAAEGKLDPLIGREKEMRQMEKTLMRRKKNNPIVVGEAGVGKTTLVEGLAYRLVKGEVPNKLKGKNIFSLDLNRLVAGTKYRGEFEERVQAVLDEVARAEGKVILFIDEVHMVLGLGSAEGAADLSNVLLKAMAKGGFSVIGATTLELYRKIEKKPALNRRFNGILLDNPSNEEALNILEQVKGAYEKEHGVAIPTETAAAAVKLAAQYLKESKLPDSAIDLLDDAASEVELQGRDTVTPNDIAVEIALRTGINAQNIGADEKARLLEMPKVIAQRVIGQDAATRSVAGAVAAKRLGWGDPRQPSSFLFLGPTGVGKTEDAKAIAEFLFGNENAMTAIDMSEFAEKHNVSRLTGAPPGYVGFESGGKLTESVRRRPNQVILLDEIDKAHPDALNILLQIIEEGRLTDGEGRVVDFSNTVIIMTANFLGAHSLGERKRAIGFHVRDEEDAPAATKAAEIRKLYIDDLLERVRPEFVNRIGWDRVHVFNELDADKLAQIVDVKLAQLNTRVAGKRIKVELSAAAKKALVAYARNDANKAFGGRPIKRAIEDQLATKLGQAELLGEIAEGDRVQVDWNEGEWTVKKLDDGARPDNLTLSTP